MSTTLFCQLSSIYSKIHKIYKLKGQVKVISQMSGGIPISAMSGEKSSQKSGAKRKDPKDKPKNETLSEEQPEDGEEASGMSSIDSLKKYLAERLHISDDNKDEDPKVKILNENTLDGIVQYIKDKKCSSIITLAGAGISTSAGIPDFRSKGSGLYHNLEKYKLPHPQAIFELDFFNRNPKPFFVLAKELYPGSFTPTLSHYFIKLLVEKNVLLRHYSQNIDTLERVAGIPGEKLVEAHGTFYTGHCLKCRKEYNLEWMKEIIFKDEIPTCKCNGIVKPDIVFFGECLPQKFYDLIETDFEECDLLIVLGSSLVVQPFASLIDKVDEGCPRLLINREKAGNQTGLMAMLGMGGGMDFDSKRNTRDVAWLGDCDDGCLLLAEKLGWGEELLKLREEEVKKLQNKEEEGNKTEKSAV